jgi:hypothetical protein
LKKDKEVENTTASSNVSIGSAVAALTILKRTQLV